VPARLLKAASRVPARPPTVVEQSGQGVGHSTQLELGVKLRVPPCRSGDVAEERAALEVFLCELGPAVAPHVDDAEPVITAMRARPGVTLPRSTRPVRESGRPLMAARVRAVVRVAAEKPTR